MSTEETSSDWAEARDEVLLAVNLTPTSPSSSTASDNLKAHDDAHSILRGKCPVCLKPLVDGVLVDACLHEFCRSCIVQWAEHLRDRQAPVRCPICRAPFGKLFANVVSADDYDVVNLDETEPSPHALARRRRALVYRRYPMTIRDVRERIWPAIYKSNDQAQPWLARELEVILGDDSDIALLQHIVLSSLDEIRTEHTSKKRKHRIHGYLRLLDTLKEFIGADAPTFVVELATFMASRLNLSAYDRPTF
ncbi:hypothetical protein ACHHYP_01307 [Achlya hypogyna]|uniref:RING-type domain-containing protein n=1 Tax=Achlya hypogyna TaxID=1202772 RepID=A0A1V9Z8T7_ACHHY|nr:hypothetical protein ACHHYP_01307 [Achlya hypogyna]